MKNNQRAINQIRSWLSATSVPHLTDAEGQGSADFVVMKRDGGLVTVLVSVKDDTRDLTGIDVVLPASDIMGRYIDRSMKAFHTLTEAAGYGSPLPVERGDVPLRADGSGKPKNLRAVDDFELVAMRHKELRRAPNPPRGALDKYIKILENICWNFIKLNSTLCSAVGMEHGDLMSYAMVYATTFIGLYEKKDGSEDENKRLLTMYVRQKLSALKRLSFDKMRSCTPDMETVDIGAYGEAFVSRKKERAHRVDMEGYLDGARVRNQELASLATESSDVSEYVERAKEVPGPLEMAASTALRERLDSMEHDQLVAALKKHAKNRDEDVAEVAMRHLRLHNKNCVICSPELQTGE